ncbi:unnamed protein product [Owenia fusiformis]|uniref:Uncharacterized protein n=1 Tax=Owenia fusiformis TaxID=6347 RepID=A0A8J1XZ14_OWEFU|nr:unnamed protein product [Owenia fusiformis]
MLLFLLHVLGGLAMVTAQGASMRRVCYYTNWSQYRVGFGQFWPEDIDANLCTHIIYAFANLSGTNIIPREWNDDGPSGLYVRVNSLKNANPELSTLLGVIGDNFEDMLATDANRAEFVANTIAYFREPYREFDGINLDFKAPSAFYSARFALLFQELRAAFDEEANATGSVPLILSCTLSGKLTEIDQGYDIPVIDMNADLINLLTYDLWASWDGATGHHSPLFQRSGQAAAASYLNWEAIVDYYILLGASVEKLNPGLAFYARTFTLANGLINGYDVPTSGPGVAGTWTATAGQLSYYEVCLDFLPAPATVVWNDEHVVPYAYFQDQWVAYDNAQSVGNKTRWATERGIGGVMTFALDMDDFADLCSEGKFPLHQTVIDNMGLCINGTECAYV